MNGYSGSRFCTSSMIVGFALALVLALPSMVDAAPASAGAAPAPEGGGGYPEILRPSTRKMFATFWLGAAAGVSGVGSQMKLGQEFGWHWSGDATGGAIGGYLHESFGSGFTAIQLGPKFWWDFAIMDGLGLYISPSASIGVAIAPEAPALI